MSEPSKPRFGLIPPGPLRAVASTLTKGAEKHGDAGWMLAPGWSTYADRVDRHMNAWRSGEDVDPETGESHLAHAAADLLLLMALQQEGFSRDDRYVTQIEALKDKTLSEAGVHPPPHGSKGIEI